MATEHVVVGVDVGGPAKGFHAVALSGHKVVGKTASRSAGEISAWCRVHGAHVVAVDAPCRWRTTGARLAERELARDGISSFSTPTEARAQGHPFFTWMIAGAELYSALAASFPVYDGGSRRHPVAIETFPQAVACALAAEIVPAKRKNDVRKEVLRLWGLDPAAFANMDEVDAALCAITADHFLRADFKSYGDAAGGFIIVPETPVAGFIGSHFQLAEKAPRAPAHQLARPTFDEILDALPHLTAAEHLALRSRLDDLDAQVPRPS